MTRLGPAEKTTQLLLLTAAFVFAYSLSIAAEESGLDTEVGGTSRFVEDVAMYPVTTGDQQAIPSLKWDFSVPVEMAYSLNQAVESTTEFGASMPMGGGDGSSQIMDMAGRLTVESSGDSTADFGFVDMQADMVMSMAGKDHKMSQAVPNMFATGVAEDGTGSYQINDMTLLIGYLFPVFDKGLASGEMVTIERTFPFNANGSSLNVLGSSTLEIVGTTDWNGREYPVVRQDILLNELSLPNGMEGDYRCHISGVAYHVYSPEDKRYLQTSMALFMEMYANMPMPKMNFGDGVEIPENFPTSQEMRMTSDNKITVRLAQ